MGMGKCRLRTLEELMGIHGCDLVMPLAFYSHLFRYFRYTDRYIHVGFGALRPPGLLANDASALRIWWIEGRTGGRKFEFTCDPQWR